MDLLSALAILFIGIFLGALLGRFFFANGNRENNLSQQLDEVHSEYAGYQQKVDDHFKTTAELVNKLTHAYSNIHEHLASGAQDLSKRTLAHTEIERLHSNPSSLQESTPIPKDYASKLPHEPGDLAAEQEISAPFKKHE